MYSLAEPEASIRARIARDGAITFREYMEMALYTAPGAYYSSEGQKIGSRGDYVTSPELHPAFGALLARQIEQIWLGLGQPDPFTLVEMGPGTGVLARDILSYTERFAPALNASIEYLLVERSPGLKVRQEATLAGLRRQGLRHLPSITQLPEHSITGCILSNELLDAFPVHRVRVDGGKLSEFFVEVKDGKLGDSLRAISAADLERYFSQLGFLPPEGCEAEVNLDATRWMRDVATRLNRGAVITFDYGYPAEELYSVGHCHGTLLCFHRHSITEDPYVRVGRQDMTSHVDFTTLRRVGEEQGLDFQGLTSQRDFLSLLGAESYLSWLDTSALPSRVRDANSIGIRELLNEHGLGRVKVMLQTRGLSEFRSAGLSPAGTGQALLGRDLSGEEPPLITRHHTDLTAPPDLGAMLDTEGMWRELMDEDDE